MKEIFLGDVIRQRRLELGLTQEELCEGICESGRRLTISWPADLPQNRAYRSGTRLLPCLRRYRLAVVRIKELEFSLLKPLV